MIYLMFLVTLFGFNVVVKVCGHCYTKLGVHICDDVAVVDPDIQTIIQKADELYTVGLSDALLNSLVPENELTSTTDKEPAVSVAEKIVKAIFKPLFKDFTAKDNLIQLINKALEIRDLGSGRRNADYDGGSFEKSFSMNSGEFNKYARRKHGFEYFDNANIENDGRIESISRLNRADKDYGYFGAKKKVSSDKSKFNSKIYNVKERDIYREAKKINELNMKEEIENYKEMETIKKYETVPVRTTAKYGVDFDKIHEKPSDIDETANRNINRTFKYNLRTNDIVLNIQEANTKNKKHKGMTIETDQKYELIPESESDSESHSSSKLDRHIKHKIRKHLRHRHKEWYKRLRKRHHRNKRRRKQRRNLKKGEDQKRFIVLRALFQK